ncbi:ferredoxin-nitrate reductase [Hydrogenivirga caldilitoris]|uniref:Ferredoxin-nitrate reductase n=1 Tax=Hydrogenivirga caldilitoris TaxID=246264 RepID=A0A497XQN2_9AQUI|nr:molybdopterin-dependent oxidoreductase [Hydrogenivirga caldilitoris]RLJ70460.1 ferredoxin-nitrate reductase [Hydrogenivirga caldilitoris]
MKTFQCPYCGVGCGLYIDEKGRIKGDFEHPANFGDICKKPIYLTKVLSKDRIGRPLYRESKSKSLREISWEEAYGILKKKLTSLSPEETYFYLSGQLLTEDIYVANKFVKGFLKTNNIDANSRLCMASAVTAYKLAFGSDGVPCTYEDIDDADAFLFIGSNAAIAHPVLFKRVLKRRRESEGVGLVTIDPVETETAKKSDFFIQIRAGTDTVFLNSVFYVLHREGWIDYRFVENYTEGFEEALETARKFPPELAASVCDVKPEDIHLVAEVFAKSEKLISFWCQGLNQSVNGTMKNLALINLHLAKGRLNEKGCPFSLTGQPNAMGGREVGYLTNGLLGYRDVRNKEDREFMEDFWGVKGIKETPGPTITEAIDLILEERIKLLWVVCTNPAVSLPELRKVEEALSRVFLVVQDAYWNDTCEFANLILPASQVGEKEGVMTDSDRTITFCEKFSEPYGESKPDWLIFTELAKAMEASELFPYSSPKEIFEEFKESTKGRLCDVSDLSYEKLPARWGRRWLYEDLRFPTESGRARFHPAKFDIATEEGEFILLTGRLKNNWHTMTKTGKSPELLKGEVPPFVLMNPKDAEELGVEEGEEIVLSAKGKEITRIVRLGNVKRGHIFAPFGYPREFGEPTNFLVSDKTDPLSKEPDLKYAGVRVRVAKLMTS